MPMRIIKNKKIFNIEDYKNARDIALFVLFEICENRRKSNTILKESFEDAERNGVHLSNTDTAFIERIVIGTMDRLITIDSVIDNFLKKPFRMLNPVIKAVLRMSVYQIMYMDRVPDSAACNEGVRLTRLHGMDGMTGFVNGVLRAVAREHEEGGSRLDLSSAPASVRYSLPEWICSLIKKEYGSEKAERIFDAYLCERHETVRYNISRVGQPDAEQQISDSLRKDGFELKAVDMAEMVSSSEYDYVPEAALPILYEVKGGGNIARAEAFRKGYVTVQDPASALVASFAAVQSGDTVIDVCSAPGGKALAVAELAGGSCRIEARDISRQKTSLISENVRRCGYKNISVRVLDALKEDEESLYRADVLIADLPCSGLGVIAKKPDIKLNLEQYSVTELQKLQRDILANVSRFVKPKGKLVYSTCTLSREENEDNTAWLETELGFRKTAECKLLPGRNNDGFYIAVLQKRY